MKRTLLHRDHIGFVFQQYHLIDELTVYENIETPLLYKKLKASERKSRVADVLDRFNMVAKKDMFPAQLSGGQQQLVGVARAIVSRPRVIFRSEERRGGKECVSTGSFGGWADQLKKQNQ